MNNGHTVGCHLHKGEPQGQVPRQVWLHPKCRGHIEDRRILGREVTLGLVSAFVTTRLDYCNSVLAGLPQASIDPLQRVQNAAARLVAGIGTRDHITPVLRSLHWLPIRLRIQYKLCVLMHQVHIGRSPAYLAELMTATADLPGRERLRSANSFRYETPKLKLKFGERAFSYAGPNA